MTLIVNSCYFWFCWWCQQCVCVSLLWDLLVWGYIWPVFLWVQLNFLVWSFPSCTSNRAGFVDTYCLNLVWSWNILFSQSILIERFAGYSSLSWHPWSLSVCETSVQDLLASLVSIEKTCVILIGLCLYVMWAFSFVAFKILSLFYMFCVLIIMWWGGFFYYNLFGVL